MGSRIIGCMSGSSLDGLDLALCSFESHLDEVKWSMLKSETLDIPSDLKEALRSASSLSGIELMRLDVRLGLFIGQRIHEWMSANKIGADCIASHGHTVFHEPHHGLSTQIGSGAHIAQATGIETITHFRTADVAAGGQGAPFAPVADRDLFSGYDGYLNLGGIVNVHLVTPTGEWKAWDIGPCNQILNDLASSKGEEYDKDGLMAASGHISVSDVAWLIAQFPFADGAPRGMSNAEVQSSWIRYLRETTLSVEDKLATAAEAIARMIANHILPLIRRPGVILVTGGGAHNTHLFNRIQTLLHTHDIRIEKPSAQIINCKESVLMAYLGWLSLTGRPFGIHTLTGAAQDTIGGALHKVWR